MLIELIEDDVRYGVALELDDDAHPFAVRFIAKIGDSFNLLLLYQTGNLLDDPIFVDHEGNFTDNDLLFAGAFDRLSESLAAHLDDAFTFDVSLSDGLLAMNETAGRKIRPRDKLHQLFDRKIRIFHQGNQSIDHFPQIVRRDIGRHADRDTGGAVDQQIGNARRQNRRFFEGVVVVRNEIDGLFFDIRQQLFGETGHPDFGVAHGRGRIGIDGAEVSLAIDERITHREILHQPDDRIVNRGIAMGMIFTDDIADETSRFFIRLIPGIPHVVHGVEHPAVDRFEPVAHVGQSAADDDAHGVVHKGLAHLVFDIDGYLLLFQRRFHIFRRSSRSNRSSRSSRLELMERMERLELCLWVKYPDS